MPFIEQDNYTAPQVPIVIKSEQQLDEEKRRHDKWYKGDAPTSSEAMARIYRIGKVNPELGKSLYESFNRFRQDKTTPFYDPYSAPTNKTVFAELSKLGIDTSNVNDDWFNTYKPLMDNAVLGIDGTPTKGKTKESKAAYYYYKASIDEPRTKAVESEWETAKQEINYWANRTDLNLSDEEILKKLDIPNKYKGLAAIDESRKTGSLYELNRPIDYNQDGLLGAIWAARNKSTGNSETDAVQYRLGNGNSYKPAPVIRERLSPTSPKFNPYLVGSTMDDVTAFFGVQSIDEKWLNENTGAIMGGDNETAKAMLQKAWKANDFTVKANAELNTLVKDDKVSKGVARTMRTEGLSLEDALVAYLDENYKELGSIAKSLKYKSPEPTTGAIGFDYYALKEKVALDAPIWEMRRKLATPEKWDSEQNPGIKIIDKIAELQKADVVAKNGDAVEGTVPETKVDSGLTGFERILKNGALFWTELWGNENGAGGGGNSPDAGGGRPSFEQTEDDTEIYSATEGRGGKFGTSFEEIEDNTETYEQPEDGIDAKRARLDELNTKLQDPAFKNVSPMNVEGYRALVDARVEAEALAKEIKQYDDLTEWNANKAERDAAFVKLNEVKIPSDFVFENPSPIMIIKNILNKHGLKTTKEITDWSYANRNTRDAKLLKESGLYERAELQVNQVLYMTDEQVSKHDYILETQGKDAAKQYYNGVLESGVNKLVSDDYQAVYQELAEKHPALATAVSVGQTIINPIEALKVAFDKVFFGEDVVAFDPDLQSTRGKATIRKVVPEDFSKLGQFAYGTFTSMLDSGASRLVFQRASLAAMGLNASGATMAELIDQGVNPNQVYTLAAINGLSESVVEMMRFNSYSKLWKASKGFDVKAVISNFFKGGLKSAFGEGMEEGATWTANLLGDMAVRGFDAEIWQQFEAAKAGYEKDGLTGTAADDAAWTAVLKAQGQDLLLNFLGGAVSGFFWGAASEIKAGVNGKMNFDATEQSYAKINDGTLSESEKQEEVIKIVGVTTNSTFDSKSEKKYEAQALDTIGIDSSIVDSIKQPLGLKKSQGLFDVLRKLNDPKTKAERVFGALIKTADPVGIAKLNLLANALGTENVQADNLVNSNLLTATNRLANEKNEQLQAELDKMPAEGVQGEPSIDFTHTLQRWGAKGLIYVNNLIQNGQKEIAVKLQSLPSFAKAVIVAEAQMESLSMDKEAVKAQVDALASDTPDVIQNGEIRAEEQAVEVQVNEVMSSQDFTAQDTAIADAQERLAQVQQEREVAEQTEADAVVQTEQLVEQANQNPADEQAIALATSALDDLAKLRKEKVKAIKAEETAKYEVNKAKMARFESEDKVRSEAEVQVRGELLKAKQAIADRKKQAKVQEQKQAEAEKQPPEYEAYLVKVEGQRRYVKKIGEELDRVSRERFPGNKFNVLVNDHNTAVKQLEAMEKRLSELTPAKPETPKEPDAPPSVQFAKGTGIDVMALASAGAKGIKSVQKIFEDLGKSIGLSFNLASKHFKRANKGKDEQGNLKTPGYYNVKSESVFTQLAQDINTVSHELGHHLDKTIKLSLLPEIRNVIEYIKANSDTSGYSETELPGEAVAEFVKAYIMNRNATIQMFGENLVNTLENGIREMKIWRPVQNAIAEITKIQAANMRQATEARIRVRKDGDTIRERLAFTFDQIFNKGKISTLLFDSTLPAQRITTAAKEQLGDDFKYSEDFRTLSLLNNRVNNFVGMNLNTMLVDLEGNPLDENGFFDLTKTIKLSDMKAFNNYKLMQHEQGRSAADKSIYKGQYTPEQVNALINEYETEHPEWKETSDKIDAWWGKFFKEYVVNRGVVSQENYDKWRTIYPHYVPTYRVSDEFFLGKSRRKQGVERVKAAVKGGSDLDIEDPIGNMARMVMAYTVQAKQLQANVALVNQLRNVEGLGHIAVEVEHDMDVHNDFIKSMDAIKKTISDERSAVEEGSEADIALVEVEDAILDGLGKMVYTVKDKTSGGNIVNILMPDGKYASLMVQDSGVFDLLNNAPVSGVNAVLRAINKLTRLVSSTATALNPIWFGGKNVQRDLQTALMYGSTATNPVSIVAKWLKGMPEYALDKLAFSKGSDSDNANAAMAYKLFVDLGSKYVAPKLKNPNKMYRDMYAPTIGGKAVQVLNLPIDILAGMNEYLENNTRYMEFKHGKDLEGNKNQLDTFEGVVKAAIASTGLTVDFGKHGSSQFISQMRLVTPFLNAALQGANKTIHAFGKDNAGRRGQIAAKFILNGVLLGISQGILRNLFWDDDEKKDVDDMDQNYVNENLLIKTGEQTFYRMPLSQDTLFQGAYVMGKWLSNVFTGEGNDDVDYLVNSMIGIATNQTKFSTVANPMLNVLENKTWYGGPIESYSDLQYGNPAYRYDADTPKVFVDMSKSMPWLNLSPKKIEYLFQQYTGVYGKLLLKTTKAVMGGDSVPEAIVSTLKSQTQSSYFLTPAYSSQASDVLYTGKKTLEGLIKADKDGKEINEFGTHVTGWVRNDALREASELTKKGGALADATETISGLWDEHEAIGNDEQLTDEEKRERQVGILRKINDTALTANGILAEYEEKYFIGGNYSGRIVSGNLDADVEGLNYANSTTYADMKSGQSYAQQSFDLYKTHKDEYFINYAPSYAWKGFDKELLTPDIESVIEQAYNETIAEQMDMYYDELNSSDTDEARAIFEKIRNKAADAAKKAAMDTDAWTD